MAAFVGQAHPFERTRPFGAIAAALDLNRRSRDPRRAATGALLVGGRAGSAAGFGGDTQHRNVEDIVDLVESSCAARPVLLVVEDIHWADQATLSAILSVSRQLTLEQLLVVVTVRPSPRSADVTRLLEDLAAGGAQALSLLPLTPDEVALLAHQVLGAAPGPELSAALAKAGGNTLWVMATLRSLTDDGLLHVTADGIEATTSELPGSLSDLVVRRLQHLPTQTLDLLRIIAVLGDAASLPTSPLSPTDLRSTWSVTFGRQQSADVREPTGPGEGRPDDGQRPGRDRDRAGHRHRGSLDVLFAVLENPSDELTEAMKYDTVLPETMAILVAS